MFGNKIENTRIFKKAVSLSAAIFLVAIMVFVFFEPEIMNASTNTNTINLTARVSQEVTISSPGDTNFSNSIPGISGNPGAAVTASRTWKVITNNPTGFDMKLHASQTHALHLDGTYYFDDYGLTPGVPAYNWSVPTLHDARFGFSVAPATSGDLDAAFFDNGSSACGSGSYHLGGCWAGFNGENDIRVIHRTSLTSASGEDEVINFKAESNARFLQADDNYTATITATASLN